MGRFMRLPGFRTAVVGTILFLFCFSIFPLGALVLKALELSPSEFWGSVTSDRALATYSLTLRTALLATVLNVLLGVPVAWALARRKFVGNRLLDSLVDLPFALPTAVAGLTLASLTGPESLVGRFFQNFDLKIAYAMPGIVLAMAFTSFPFVVRMVQPVLANIDREVEEAAISLGASRWRRAWFVILPQALPAIIGGASLAFVRSIGEFGAIVFISGNLPFRTEVSSLLLFTRVNEFEYPQAAALAVVILAFSLIFLLFTQLAQNCFPVGIGESESRRQNLHGTPLGLPQKREPGASLNVLPVFAGGVIFLVIVIPLGAIFSQAFALGLGSFFSSIGSKASLESIQLSLVAAGIAVTVNTMFGLLAAWLVANHEFFGRKLLISLIELPLAISPVILGVGYLFLFGLQGILGSFLAEYNLSLVFNATAVILVTTMVTAPLVFRELLPAMVYFGKDEEMAASTLGAGFWRSLWKVTLPKIRLALFFGVALCFARSLGEFGSVAVVSGSVPGRTNTMTLQINLLFHDAVLSSAFALASILALVAVFTLIVRSWVMRH